VEKEKSMLASGGEDDEYLIIMRRRGVLQNLVEKERSICHQVAKMRSTS
jgi:hypothetical protein